MTSRFYSRRLSPLRLALPTLAVLFPAWAGADSLTVHSGGANTSGINYDGVHVERIEGGQIFYNINGDERNKDVAQVATMKIDDEPAFNDAEAAYRGQKWADAVDGFAKTLSSTDKGWLKDWVAPRLLDAANHANRFDAAVSAWTQMAVKDPGAAAKVRPSLPAANSPYLATAAAQLADSAKAAKSDSRQLLLGLLLDVDTARNDTAGAAAVAKELGAATPTVPGSSAGPADTAAQSIEGQTKVALARTALSGRDYDQAVSLIDGAAPSVTEPAQQAEALFIRAQGLEGKAAAGDDADAWKDVALAYMRVYAHFPTGPASGHSAEALLKAADVEEKHLKEPAAALTLYQKVVGEYKDTPAAREAAQDVNRLTAKQ